MHGLGLLALVALIQAIFHVNLSDVAKIVYGEVKTLLHRERSMGTYNMAGIIACLFFGSMTIAALEFDKVIRILDSLIGKEQINVFQKTASFETMFYLEIIFLIVSLVAVLLDKWRRRG